MKHKIGDVVLVPMRIGGGWVNSKGTGHFVEVWGEASSTFGVSDAFLDTCAAAPRVPKVGDPVLFEKHQWEVVAIRGDYGILWNDELGSADELLSALTIIDEPSP